MTITPANPPFPRVKICGVTQLDQALAIAALGADYLGFNFWPRSKRHLPWEQAAAWLDQLPSSTKAVGVFVNPDAGQLIEMAQSGLLHAFQLHGDESPDFCHLLIQRGLPLIKAFQVRHSDSLRAVSSFAIDDVLLDAYHPHERGGHGQVFPWELARTFRQSHPQRALWLAGGLVPDNVARAVHGTRPAVVDVASGVEDAVPGIKNLAKVAAFINAAKQDPGQSG